MAHELVSFEDLRKELELEKETIEEYQTLAVLKPSVEDAIENFLGRELESKERTEAQYLGTVPTRMVSLKGLPVASVSAVTITDRWGNTESLTHQADYRITPFGIRLFSKRKDVDISVTYTGGYEASAIPGDITRAAFLQTVYEFKKSPNLGAETVSTEGGSINYPELGLLKHVKELLYKHVHPLRA